jgi:hypothetical protein
LFIVCPVSFEEVPTAFLSTWQVMLGTEFFLYVLMLQKKWDKGHNRECFEE